VSVDHDSEPWWRSRAAKAVLSIAVVVAIFAFLLPRVADYGGVWRTVRALTPLEMAALAVVSLWNLASYWPLLVAVLPGLRLREAAVVNLSSTAAANSLPGGAAIGIGVSFAMLRSWGFDAPAIALSAVLSGIWNNFWKLGMPVVALAALVVVGDAQPALATAAAVGVATLGVSVAVFVMVVRSDALAARLGRAGDRLIALVRRQKRALDPPLEERAVEFREQAGELTRKRWVWITLATAVSHVSLWLVLLVALRNVGISDDELSWVRVLAAFSFVRLISAIPITPGGVGVAELGLTIALGHGLGRDLRAEVAAAVLLFRALTWFAPIPLGIGCYVFWRTNESWRRDDHDDDSSEDVTSEPSSDRVRVSS
jgi:uncharacterized protein (TIRG00374 family)